MGKIISFSGRLQSGKTELASICEKYGYEKLYFALPLKQLCADLLDISIDELNRLKVEKEKLDITMDDNFCAIISYETEIPLKTVMDSCDGVLLKDVRHMLQFIGTDLIRKYNTNWHVNRIHEMINPDKNYVFDDVRFPNELGLINELGGDSWFIIRPKIDNVSNHESETALSWKDFGNKLIINDSSLELFNFKWEVFLKNYEKATLTRNKTIGNNNIANLYGELSEPLCVLDMLEISPHLFNYEDRDFNCDNIKSIRQMEDNSVYIEYKDGSNEIVKNPISIECLKLCINNN